MQGSENRTLGSTKSAKNAFLRIIHFNSRGPTKSAENAFLKTIHFKSRGPKFGPLVQLNPQKIRF